MFGGGTFTCLNWLNVAYMFGTWSLCCATIMFAPGGAFPIVCGPKNLYGRGGGTVCVIILDWSKFMTR